MSASGLRTEPGRLERDSFSNYRQHYRGRIKSNDTLGSRLEKLARIIPDGLAFIQGNRSLTWKEFDQQVNRLANALLDLGIKRGERVGVVGFSSIEWMVANFAIAKIGAVSFFLDPKFTFGEIAYVIKDADAVAVIVEGGYASIIARVTEGMLSLRYLIVYDVGKVPQLIPRGAVIYDDLMARYPSAKPRLSYRVTNEDFAHLEYTIGDAGYPVAAVWDYERLTKSVMLIIFSVGVPIVDRGKEEVAINFRVATFPIPGYRTLLHLIRPILDLTLWKKFYLRFIRRLGGTTLYIKLKRLFRKEGYKVLPACPSFFEASYNPTLGNIFASGACTVFLPTPYPFDAREFWETVEREKVNMAVISGDPFAIPIVEELRRVQKVGRRYDLSSLGIMLSSGVTWEPHLKKELLELIPYLITIDAYGGQGCGVTYASINCSGDEEITPLQIRGDRKGVYAFQAPCKVINPETAKEVKPGLGEIGDFLTGGYSALGFWKNPGETKRAFMVVDECKYFYAGDEGYVDERGWVHLVGRKGIEVTRSGEVEVYTDEIEEVIKAHPRVRDAAVVVVADEKLGEAVAAIVDIRKGEELNEEELIEYCHRSLSEGEIPKHVIFVESLPRSPSGKIDKKVLKEFAESRLGIR